VRATVIRQPGRGAPRRAERRDQYVEDLERAAEEIWEQAALDRDARFASLRARPSINRRLRVGQALRRAQPFDLVR